MPAEQLTPLVLNDLGIYGLNTQASPGALPPQWLAVANNIILDEQGRISSRRGIQQVSENIGSTSSNTYIVKSIGEYFAQDGTRTLYAGANDKIYKIDTTTNPYLMTEQTFSTVKEGTATSVTPQTITDGNWQWINFNHEFYGFQSGHMAINYNGTGWFDMDHTADWTIPSGISTFDPSCGMGKFGRMWVGGISEDPGTLYYSDTLIGEDFNGGASGAIDLSTVWGSDRIVNIAEFSDKMVIFGTENIAIYSNPWDPDNMVLFDLITGVGLKARDSVAQIGNDLVFLSASGLRSLERIIATDGKMPLMMLSKNIRTELERNIISSDMDRVKGQFCLCGGFYMLAFPDRDLIYYFDFTIKNPDQTPRVAKFVFDSNMCPTSLLSTVDGTMYMGRGATNKYGNVAIYQNYWDRTLADDTSTSATYNGSLEIELDLSTSTAGSPAAYDAVEAEAYCETQLGGNYNTGTKLCTLIVDVNDTAPTPDTSIVDPTFSWSGAGTDYCTLGGFTYSGGSCTIPLNTSATCSAIGNTWEATNSKCWSTTNSGYLADFRTVWLDFNNPSITKIFKRFFGVIVGGKDMNVDFSWYRDYNVAGDTASFTLQPTATGDEYTWGDSGSIWGTATYAPGFNPTEYKLALAKTGKVVQIKMSGEINGYKASLQSLTILAKTGKIR